MKLNFHSKLLQSIIFHYLFINTSLNQSKKRVRFAKVNIEIRKFETFSTFYNHFSISCLLLLFLLTILTVRSFVHHLLVFHLSVWLSISAKSNNNKLILQILLLFSFKPFWPNNIWVSLKIIRRCRRYAFKYSFVVVRSFVCLFLYLKNNAKFNTKKKKMKWNENIYLHKSLTIFTSTTTTSSLILICQKTNKFIHFVYLFLKKKFKCKVLFLHKLYVWY